MVKDKYLHPIHPGEILREELLKSYKITPQQLAQSVQVESQIIEELVNEQRDITPKLSYRLGYYWGVRKDYWLDLQRHYDKVKKLKKIRNKKSPFGIRFQYNLWRLDSQVFKNLMDNTLSKEAL